MSTNGRDRFVPVESGKGATYPGWQESLSTLVQRLQRSIQGVKDRLRVPSTEMSIWPSAVTGRRIFTPEAGVEQVDTTQSTTAPGPATLDPVNVVVRSGRRYNIPMIFPGPGVFVGRWLKVALYMRLHNPQMKGDTETWLPMCSNTGVNGEGPEPIPFTTRFSIFPVQPQLPGITGGTIKHPPALNYFWNLQDPRSGRLYSDRPMSHMMLLPATWQFGVSGSGDGFLGDGDLYDLKAPWLFERDGQLTFTMDPITDLYQFDSSINGTAAPMDLPFDDRENGKRDQSVLVQVEMHGFRFETMQDAVRAGALTQRWEDESDGAVIPTGTAGLARKTR